MRLYPKRIALEANILSTKLPFDELKGVLNQLVPLNVRGAKKASFGITETGGGAAWTTYPYEKVTFIFITSFKVNPDSLKDSKPYIFSIQPSPSDAKPENPPPSEDDFFPGQASNTEIVTIKWNERQCCGK